MGEVPAGVTTVIVDGAGAGGAVGGDRGVVDDNEDRGGRGAEIDRGDTRETRARDGHRGAAGLGTAGRAQARDRRRGGDGEGEPIFSRDGRSKPARVITVTSTVPVPAGLMTSIVVSSFTKKDVAAVVPKSTSVAPVKPVPVMITSPECRRPRDRWAGSGP